MASAETAATRRLSAGKKVTVEGRAYLGVGKVAEVRTTPRNGEYVLVQFGSKKNYRPSQLTRA